MKNLLLILFVLISSICFAGKKYSNKGSTRTHSYKEYVDLYGENDTSRALIELFFDKREFCAGGKMSFLPLSLGVVLLSPPLGIGLMVLSTPLFISGIVTRKKYNHKNLQKFLSQYNKNGKLSKKLDRQVKLILIAEHEESKDFRTSDRKMALRSIILNDEKGSAGLIVN